MSEIIHPAKTATVPVGPLVACWSCKGPVDQRALFCHTCSAVQPPHAIDHFTRLGLAPRFDIEAKEIERNYFGFLRIVHPDRFAAKSAREKTLSQAQSVAFNDAYETLRHPISRAIHLLTLLGAPLPTDDHSVKDASLLMAAMEDREALSAASSVAEVDDLAAKAHRDFDRLIGQLSGHFESGDLAAAQSTVLRLRYLDKLREDARVRRARLERN